MKAVFPGKPQATLRALSTASWKGTRIIAYISGNELIILGGHNELLQTIGHEGDEELSAVAINPESGKIATCTASEVHIYKRYGADAADLRWFLQHSYSPACGDKSISTLSWGETDEILLGGSYLTVISTSDGLHEQWTRRLANNAKHAAFHYDASMVASTGWRDRLVKVWKRNSFGEQSERFDATYLSHPAMVTSLWWRGRPPGVEHADPVLYTLCTDNMLRVWTTLDPHALQALQLWVEVDLTSCTQPPEPLSPSVPGSRYLAVIDNWDFKAMIKKLSSSRSGGEREEHIRERLAEIASRDPEICLVFDNDGNLSAWGLERVGSKTRHFHEVFNIAHGKQLALQEHDFKRCQAFFQALCFANYSDSASISILAHSSDGRIECFESLVERLFDPSSAVVAIAMQAAWTGHSKPVEKLDIVENELEPVLISYAPGETLYWDVTSQRRGLSLRRQGIGLLPERAFAKRTVKHALVNGNSAQQIESQEDTHKKAIADADGTSFGIWDSKQECLEYSHSFGKHETIQSLRWTLVSSVLPVLAVSLLHKVDIFIPLHFKYSTGAAAWKCFREIDLRDLTSLPVAHTIWLPSGDLLLAAGNQMFLYGPQEEEVVELTTDIQHLELDKKDLRVTTWHLNSLLPRFHSQLLSYYVLFGQFAMAHEVLLTLHHKLKYFTEGDRLDSQLDFRLELDDRMDFKHEEVGQTNLHYLTEEVAGTLNDNLNSVQLPHVTKDQQNDLRDIIECVGATERHLRSVDQCGMLYLILLEKHRLDGRKPKSNSAGLPWRDVMWAYLSTSEEILLDLTARRYQGRMLWRDAKACGVFMWMTDLESLRTAFENIARNEYTKTDEKNPIDCSLYYIALRKKQVLMGLWRMATWHREQRATSRLLANNFDDPRWKTAALKNAYALMGFRRFQYAAAFFLLADHLKDAVGVLLNQAEDMQLAIAVARVYEGDEGPVLRELLHDKVLPRAASQGNKWLAAWAFCMLGQRHMALQALVKPLESIIETQEAPGPQAKHFLTLDPAMVTLYRLLRDDVQKSRKGAAPAVSIKDESDFVLRNAQILCRMGCDVLALDLVRNWKFVHPPPGRQYPQIVEASKEAAEPRESHSATEAIDDQLRLDGIPPKRVVVTEEPSANSILDSFNF